MPTWILIASNIAAFITALAALFTVLEMRRQRKSSYLPDFAFEPKNFSLYKSESNSNIPLSYFDKSKKTAINNSLERVNLRCFNVGFGTAKEVSLSWEFDVLEFANLITKTDSEIDIKVWKEKFGVEIESEKLKIKKMHMDGQLSQKIHHVMPVSISDQPLSVLIPPMYMDLYSIYIYSNIKRMQSETEESKISSYEEPPVLKLSMSFNDIEGKTHNQKFEFTPLFYSMTAPKKLEEDQLLVNGEIRYQSI